MSQHSYEVHRRYFGTEPRRVTQLPKPIPKPPVEELPELAYDDVEGLLERERDVAEYRAGYTSEPISPEERRER